MNDVPKHYVDGPKVQIGDIVDVNGALGHIESVFSPGTKEAAAFHCWNTGGILVCFFETNDLQLWSDADEDLVFVSRKD